MANAQNTDEDEPELTEYARTSIRQSLKSSGVGVNDGWENWIQLIDGTIQTEDGQQVDQFEVLVDIAGRLDLNEVMQNHGLLIYCRDGVEIKIQGFEDESVLLDVIQRHDDDHE